MYVMKIIVNSIIKIGNPETKIITLKKNPNQLHLKEKEILIPLNQ